MPRKAKSSMTVAELKALLEQYPETAPVYFTYDYGDHWHTIVAKEITSVDEGAIVYSDYHSMNKVDEEPADDAELAILIG